MTPRRTKRNDAVRGLDAARLAEWADPDDLKMTGVSRQSAEERWELIKGAGLDRPMHPPAYWT